MAFVDANTRFDDGQGFVSDFIYNVTMAVDANQGQQQDVMLVQYFLANIYWHPNAFQPPFPPPPPYDFAVDGLFGPITGQYIQAFQDVVRNAGLPIVNDGRVDSALPGGITPIHQAVYTIIYLNSYFKIARPDIPFNDIAANDPDCPAQLKNLFCLQL